MNRGTVTVQLLDLLDGTSLSELQKLINSAAERLKPEQITNARLDISYERGYYNDVSITVTVVGQRPETDEEYAIRTENHRNTSAAAKEMRRKEFYRLRKEFGNEQ